MVVLFTAEKTFKQTLRCWSHSQSQTHVAAATTRPIFQGGARVCRWTAFIATCPTVVNPVDFALTDIVGTERLKVLGQAQ